jgi:hypothetical protein
MAGTRGGITILLRSPDQPAGASRHRVEDVEEPFAALEPAELRSARVVDDVGLGPVVFGESDSLFVGEAELVEVGAVPARERVFDRVASWANVCVRAAASVHPSLGQKLRPLASMSSSRGSVWLASLVAAASGDQRSSEEAPPTLGKG